MHGFTVKVIQLGENLTIRKTDTSNTKPADLSLVNVLSDDVTDTGRETWWMAKRVIWRIMESGVGISKLTRPGKCEIAFLIPFDHSAWGDVGSVVI
jgi:hypothetical protein